MTSLRSRRSRAGSSSFGNRTCNVSNGCLVDASCSGFEDCVDVEMEEMSEVRKFRTEVMVRKRGGWGSSELRSEVQRQ